MRSRKSMCYVIEEEQMNDSELAGFDGEFQSKQRYNNYKSVLSESGQNISQLRSKNENVVTICSNTERDVCLEYMDVSSSDDENEAFHGSFNFDKISENHRRIDDILPVERLSLTSSTDEHEHQGTFPRDSFLVKSGVLVLVSSDQCQRSQLKRSNSSRCATSAGSFPPRCPTIVKVHRSSFEKYAVVTGTRRHLNTPSLFLKLKNNHVTQSLSNPSQFVVFIEGITGQSFTFEASNPEKARQWMQAFTVEPSYSRMFSHYREHAYKPRQLRENPSHLVADGVVINHSLQSWSTPFLSLQDCPSLPVLSESVSEDDEEINR